MSFGTYSFSALGNLFRKPVTTAFPFKPYEPIPESRGQISIKLADCNYCTLCALRCPSGAIKVDRVGKSWELDPMRCVVCSACVEACVKNALTCESSFAEAVVVAR
jgi:ech hydrogenase subunit F